MWIKAVKTLTIRHNTFYLIVQLLSFIITTMNFTYIARPMSAFQVVLYSFWTIIANVLSLMASLYTIRY